MSIQLPTFHVQFAYFFREKFLVLRSSSFPGGPWSKVEKIVLVPLLAYAMLWCQGAEKTIWSCLWSADIYIHTHTHMCFSPAPFCHGTNSQDGAEAPLSNQCSHNHCLALQPELLQGQGKRTTRWDAPKCPLAHRCCVQPGRQLLSCSGSAIPSDDDPGVTLPFILTLRGVRGPNDGSWNRDKNCQQPY